MHPDGELSSFVPHALAGAGFFAMVVAMFAPLASTGDPATALRASNLPFMTPLLGLIVIVVVTGAMCAKPRILRAGRAAAPLLGLLLSAAVGGEIYRWWGKNQNPDMGLDSMVSAGTWWLIGGILLMAFSVLAMRPATAAPHR